MTRPRCGFHIKFFPKCRKFKPEGVSADKLEFVEVTSEEAEALRLKDVNGLDQADAAKEMNISQSTFQRIITSAHKKTSLALIRGKAIEII